MNLSHIHIKNFRSIKDEEIKFNHNCLVLLGKNEAGKTNVLKAISSLFAIYKVSDKDKRKRIENEKITENYIRAVFNLTPSDFKTIEERFRKKYKGFENISFKSGKSYREFIEKVFRCLLLQINISENQKPEFSYWRYAGSEFELEKQLFIADNTISNSAISGMSSFNLISRTFEIVKELYGANPLKCHYWQHNDNFLLPNTVNIEDFISNPSDFKALENIFALCGREDIKTEFEMAKAEDGDYLNLLEQISKKVTLTFQKIWKDFKGTSIQLIPNGDEILIKIVDKAKYNFEDRSDGFKKFISILLMISTRSRANKMFENDIILIDEPDQSLYPTSAKYLKDELIEISKKSKVIYSTHSQYMIDSENLDRHLVVEKIDDVTTIKREDINAPYTKDELLRRAIGSSIFECLKPKNIIFEGFLDKELFTAYINFNKVEFDTNTYGTVYLSGIVGVETLVQILILAKKKFIIVADSDETSNKKRIDFERNYPEYKNYWLSYADIFKPASTMEDFFTISHVKSQLQKNGYELTYDESKNVNFNIEKAVNKDKELKQTLKKSILTSAKKTDILIEYGNYVEALKNKISTL
ncbi:ATP-dependent endonuclease [Flavobacterium sp. ASV13]|uniref:ATP-dependent nuclease n=1 Tax=Flavobacterium sp. ASV13 TaxID=1506583 RepID=UPI00054F286C|nr:AAA family ATPase [Flavobacterium sp. ASV13]